MAKELPYFQFESAAYLAGNIQMCSLEAQGLFINICAIYWQRGCEISVEQINKRFHKPELLNELLQAQILTEKVGTIKIAFLLSQFEWLSKKSKINSTNGLQGANKRWGLNSPAIATPLRTDSEPHGETIAFRREEIRRDKKIEDNVPIHPLCLWIQKTLPNVSKLKNQLTDSEAENLIKKFQKPLIREILEAMENKSDLTKKYRSVNLTVQSWIKLRLQKNPEITPPKKQDYSAQDDFYSALQAV